MKMFNKADKVLRDIEKVANERGSSLLPIIGVEKGNVLGEVVKKYQPKLILEIGTLVGYSAILMARHLKGKIISIDISSGNHEAAKANIERAGLSNKVELIVGDALEVIPTLGGPFDMVFIDARKEDYLKYLETAEPLMTENAIVVADNVVKFKTGMKDFLEYVRNSGVYKSELHDFGFDGVEVSRRSK